MAVDVHGCTAVRLGSAPLLTTVHLWFWFLGCVRPPQPPNWPAFQLWWCGACAGGRWRLRFAIGPDELARRCVGADYAWAWRGRVSLARFGQVVGRDGQVGRASPEGRAGQSGPRGSSVQGKRKHPVSEGAGAVPAGPVSCRLSRARWTMCSPKHMGRPRGRAS